MEYNTINIKNKVKTCKKGARNEAISGFYSRGFIVSQVVSVLFGFRMDNVRLFDGKS